MRRGAASSRLHSAATKTSSFGLGDVLRLSERIGRPVVWDALHHRCHDPDAIPDREALALALATWPSGLVPKVHYASAA
jgi:UV DNA damage endonuclease